MIIPTRDCWKCFGAVEVEPRGFTEHCPHCGAFDPHGSPPERTREAFDAMEREQAEEYADYLRRCGGVPISRVKP